MPPTQVGQNERRCPHSLRDNVTWGAPRIRAELCLLGYEIAESTVAKYMPRRERPPSPSWRCFLESQVKGLASMDFFVAPTLTFQWLYGFVILRHDRRQVVHFNVTRHPTAAWVQQQLREAFPYETAPRYLIRDNDAIYSRAVQATLRQMGVEEVRTAPRSPWQSPYVERWIGTLRREVLDHVIVYNERHLRKVVTDYLVYYHQARCHQSLEDNAPEPREVEPPTQGEVVAVPYLGGLHHRYTRCA